MRTARPPGVAKPLLKAGTASFMTDSGHPVNILRKGDVDH
jgi:hypothetical protein